MSIGASARPWGLTSLILLLFPWIISLSRAFSAVPMNQQQQQLSTGCNDFKIQLGRTKIQPLTRTIFFGIPLSDCSTNIRYTQKSTNGRVEGIEELCHACALMEESFQSSDIGGSSGIVQSNIKRKYPTAQDTVLIQWEVTWVPSTITWLEQVGKMANLEIVHTPYNHLSNQISTFSWKAVGTLFMTAWRTKTLQIPLACIEGTSTLRFAVRPNHVKEKTDSTNSQNVTNDNNKKLQSITESLVYADDLRRGKLLNRRCANDLRLFLELGRRLPTSVLRTATFGTATTTTTTTTTDATTTTVDDWDNVVARALPWSSVPGNTPLDMEPMDEGEEAYGVWFLAVTALILFGFGNIIAPELIGQSLLFGPPNYIVRPEDLNSIF